VRVAIVTPYCRESDDVWQACIDSVCAQTRPCQHVLVADGLPRPCPAGAAAITLPASHGDNGNTARAVGSIYAVADGFDAIAYLDADNWYAPSHVAAMVELASTTGAEVCIAARTIHRRDGSLMFRDHLDSDGIHRADTSCLFLTRRAFSLVSLWATMPRELSPICDRVFWGAICAAGLRCSAHDVPTVAFRTQYAVHYEAIGERAPAGSKTREDSTGPALEWLHAQQGERATMWRALLDAPAASRR
jgi:hypothetical protein